MYNILGEGCIFIISVLLAVNLCFSSTFSERRLQLFFGCVISIALCTMTNILSVYGIAHYEPEKHYLYTAFTTTYFVLLQVPTYLFNIFAYEYCSAKKRHARLAYHLLMLPYLLYVIIVLASLKTGWVFHFDYTEGYIRGPLKNVTYGTTGTYALILMGIVIYNRKHLSRRLRLVFNLFPVCSLSIMAIQFFFPHLIMTGTALLAPTLLCYLTVQNELSEVDMVTGLYTGKRLKHELGSKLTGTFSLVSIDNYSDLIENLGTDNSRELVFQFSSTLTDAFGNQVFYLDGGRFGIVTDNNSIIKKRMSAVLREMSSFITSEGFSFIIDCHAAVMSVPENATSYNQAIDLSNRLLQHAKINRQRVIWCDSTYFSEITRQNQIYEILLRELNANSEQFQVYFQPIYSISEKRFTYAEALSRLIDTEIGTIRPDEFVRVAENKGLIERLGNIAFEKICKFLSEHPDTIQAVSVNFSVHQMMNPFVVDTVLNTIKKYHIEPKNIIMEITESIFIDDFETIREHMIKLAEAGIIFYLDDFGTGYSNFANVLTLPFTTIKIDRSLVITMENDTESYEFVKSLIKSFKSTGKKILVEGVETKEQDLMVREAGTDYIQGYLYSKPLPVSECLTVLSQGEHS